MHFGPMRATAIDLCVRDFVRFSAIPISTIVVAEEVETDFEDIDASLVRPGAGPAAFAERNPVSCARHRSRPAASPYGHAIARLMAVPVALHRHGLLKLQRFGLEAMAVDGETFSLSRADRRKPGRRGGSAALAPGLSQGRWRWSITGSTPPTGARRAARGCHRSSPAASRPKKVCWSAAAGLARVLAARRAWRAQFLLAEQVATPTTRQRVRDALEPVAPRVEWQ